MGFVEAVRTCLFGKFFQFRGRAPRAEYWWFVVFVSVGVGVLDVLGGPALANTVFVVTTVPLLAVTARRLHDTDRSTWWLLLDAPGWLFFQVLEDYLDSVGEGATLVLLLVAAISSLIMFWFMVEKGDAWDNRYGPTPTPDAVLGLSRPGGPLPTNRG